MYASSLKKTCLKRKYWQELKELDPKPSSDSHMLEKDKWHNALRVAPLKIDSKALNHKT
jgi:hypothetical protein